MDNEPISVFISYSHKDESHKEDLESHLAMLRREGLINDWNDRKIIPGVEFDEEINSSIEKADLILFLVSSDFLASDYCWHKEMKFALDRHEAGVAHVIPIVIRAVDWKTMPFAKLKALPKDAKPLTTWSDKDVAWLDVVSGIRDTVKKIATNKKRVRQRHEFQAVKQVLIRGVDRIDTLFRHDSCVTGLSTGFPDLDGMTSGLQPGDLIVLSGRPSMGKTALALNVMENVAINLKMPVAFCSSEMPSEQLGMRLMASIGRINLLKVRTGQLEDNDWPRLTYAIGLLAEAPIFIDDSRMRSLDNLMEQIRKLKKDHGLGLVVVDSLTLFSGERTSSMGPEVVHAARSLKRLAVELDVPIIAISNAKRDVETRTNKRPTLSDLDDSGDASQYADVVLFLYRDEIYNDDSPEKGITDVIVAKQRNGPTGKLQLVFLAEFARFEKTLLG